jgi:hypothetical protein
MSVAEMVYIETSSTKYNTVPKNVLEVECPNQNAGGMMHITQ